MQKQQLILVRWIYILSWSPIGFGITIPTHTHAHKTHKNGIRRLKWKWGFISTFNPNNLAFAIDYQCSIWNSLITMSFGCCKLWARVKFTNIIEWIRQFRIPVEFVAMSGIAHNRQAIGIADLWKWNEIRPNECGVDLSAKTKCKTITKKWTNI